MDLADYLADSGHGSVTLVTVDELTEDERAAEPPWFVEALGEDGPDGIIAATNHWQSVVPGALDDAVALFCDRAVGLYLGREARQRDELVLIYVLRGGKERDITQNPIGSCPYSSQLTATSVWSLGPSRPGNRTTRSSGLRVICGPASTRGSGATRRHVSDRISSARRVEHDLLVSYRAYGGSLLHGFASPIR
jgi:hypothetical protein